MKKLVLALTTVSVFALTACGGSKEKVDELTEKLKADGFKIISGPRTAGDGYYESCVIGFENNQIEITV